MLGNKASIIVVIILLIKKTGEFDILNDISGHLVLVQLVDTSGNVNHAVNIIGFWIYYSTNKIALTFMK